MKKMILHYLEKTQNKFSILIRPDKFECHGVLGKSIQTIADPWESVTNVKDFIKTILGYFRLMR